jgi:hypothetical protein
VCVCVCVCWQIVPELYVIKRGLKVKMTEKVPNRLNAIVDGTIRNVDRFICMYLHTYIHACLYM